MSDDGRMQPPGGAKICRGDSPHRCGGRSETVGDNAGCHSSWSLEAGLGCAGAELLLQLYIGGEQLGASRALEGESLLVSQGHHMMSRERTLTPVDRGMDRRISRRVDKDAQMGRQGWTDGGGRL